MPADRGLETAMEPRQDREQPPRPLPVKRALALGRPDLYPQRLRRRGFPAGIDAVGWLIAGATHTLTDRGLTTSIEGEPASS